jgi:hypothetical protein
MLRVRFESRTPVFEQAKTFLASDRVAIHGDTQLNLLHYLQQKVTLLVSNF